MREYFTNADQFGVSCKFVFLFKRFDAILTQIDFSQNISIYRCSY